LFPKKSLLLRGNRRHRIGAARITCMEQEKKNTYQRKYPREEVAAIKAWFDRHDAELPETLQLDDATRYLHLKTTVAAYFEVYGIHGDNPTFSGQIHQLFLIRQRLEEMGIKD
jgi:hypothetical protein